MGRVFVTLLIGGVGAFMAWMLAIPAPFLTGPAAMVTLASLMGVQTDIPVPLRDSCFTAIGLGMGAGVTPEVLASAARWPLSLFVLSAALGVIFFGGAKLLQRFYSLDRNTARLSAAPGHLSYVLSLSTEIRADVPVVTVIQALRVLFLTLLVPAVVSVISDVDLGMTQSPGAPISLIALGLTAVLAVGLGLILKRLHIPASYLLAGMICSTIGHGSGLTPGAIPLWVSLPSFAIMGMLIGARFSGVTMDLIRRSFGAAFVLAVLALFVTVLAAMIVSASLGFSMIDLLIAFAPGGLETMAALAIMLDADPAFVALHHVYRIVFLTFLVPAFVTWDHRVK
jgi:membrane AbrB-like protein